MFPVHIMVFGVVTSGGHVMPPHDFEEGRKVNQDVYQNVAAIVVNPWIEEIVTGRQNVFQQDTDRKIQWVENNLF